jgi:hypothetical protein
MNNTIQHQLLAIIDEQLKMEKITRTNLEKSLNKDGRINRNVNSRIFYLTTLASTIQKQKEDMLKNISLLDIPEEPLKKSEMIQKEIEKSNSALIEYLNYRLKRVTNDKKIYLEYKGTSLEEYTSFNSEEFDIISNIYSIAQKLIEDTK